MIKVITYGTYDLLHDGHIRLLERAKALGDYLIVGVTADDFDKSRGKINVKQTLVERIEAVKSTGLADEIIVEEYEGQKIDDVLRYNINIFTVGSDWTGKFDYLKEYCDVVYLTRTEGISSSSLRADEQKLKIGVVGEFKYWKKFSKESRFVNGIKIAAVCSDEKSFDFNYIDNDTFISDNFDEILPYVDALYIASNPSKHYDQIKKALNNGKHVLAESILATNQSQCIELMNLSDEKGCILMPAIKTAYSTAYSRLLLLAKSGIIGKIVSIDATCTSLQNFDSENEKQMSQEWNSIFSWGPTAMLPIFQLLGTTYNQKTIITKYIDSDKLFDAFTKIDFIYDDAVASVKVGKGMKSEGELIISGTNGYIYVPAPWWKTDYFEIRYENPEFNKRYFYQLDGEGIRYEIIAFVKNIQKFNHSYYITKDISIAISNVIGDYCQKKVIELN